MSGLVKGALEAFKLFDTLKPLTAVERVGKITTRIVDDFKDLALITQKLKDGVKVPLTKEEVRLAFGEFSYIPVAKSITASLNDVKALVGNFATKITPIQHNNLNIALGKQITKAQKLYQSNMAKYTEAIASAKSSSEIQAIKKAQEIYKNESTKLINALDTLKSDTSLDAALIKMGMLTKNIKATKSTNISGILTNANGKVLTQSPFQLALESSHLANPKGLPDAVKVTMSVGMK